MHLRSPGTAAAALALFTLAGCGNATEPASAPAGGAEPVQVVASTDVYGAIVEAVGGERVAVTTMINSPTADPEQYEATPADAVAVAEADLVIGNGEGYDDWLPQLVEAAGGERTVLQATEVSGLADQVPEGEEFNEHVWFSLPAVQSLADRVAEELGTLSPDDAATFTDNAANFNEQVDELQTRVDQIRAQHEGRRVASTEPLPIYLLDSAGLVNEAPEEFMESSEEGTDAPAAVVQEMLALFGADPVGALLLNTQTQTAATDQVAQAAEAAGVPVVPVNETLSEGATDYVGWMGGQIDALADALNAS